MPLTFHPEPGTILTCTYDRNPPWPEMTKRRPVVVISPRLKRRTGLCTVVPLSTTKPVPTMPWQVRIELAEPLPPPYERPVMWAKCDMLGAVSFARLDRFHRKDHEGKRRYFERRLAAADLRRIREAVAHWLGLARLT